MSSESESPKIYNVALAFYLVLALGGVLWLGWMRGQLGLELFLDRATWWRDILAGLASALALLGGWALAGRYFESIGRLEEKIKDLLGPIGVDEALGLAFVSGFAEELFFRGAVQGAWGWVAATAVFALLHSGPGPEYRPWTLFAAVAGVCLAGLTIWSGNLLAAMTCHIAVNGASLTRLAREMVNDEVRVPPSQ